MFEEQLSNVVLEEAIRGSVALERDGGITPIRLPLGAFDRMADDLSRIVARQAAGIRLEIMTAATRVQLDVRILRHVFAGTDPESHEAGFAATSGTDVLSVVSTQEGTLVIESAEATRTVEGAPVTLTFALGASPTGQPRRVQLWLPHNAEIELLALRADATWVPFEPAEPRWVHHGSSISHCLEATGPLGVWPVIAARALGLGITDIGLAGNSMLDPYVARALRDIEADLISFKVGINIVNGDAFTERTLVPALHGFIDTVREGHPHTPLVVISPVYCGIHEETSGPTIFDPGTGLCSAAGTGSLNLGEVRHIVERVVATRARDDSALHLIDGRVLLGEEDAAHLWDNLHPDPAGYQLIGKRFAEELGPSGLALRVARRTA